MPGNLGIDQLAPMGLQLREGPFLVGANQPAVAGDICRENGGQPAFDTFHSQSGAPQPPAKIPAFALILALQGSG